MPVAVVQCDTCNRKISVPTNVRGVDFVQRCIITQGCRGKLHYEKILQTVSRGNAPAPAKGLDDFFPRLALYDHEQPLMNTVWTINHNLGVNPFVETYVTVHHPDGTSSLTPASPEITIVDENTIKLNFDKPESGFAQAVARSSKEFLKKQVVQTAAVKASTTDYQISAKEVLSIATLLDDPVIDIELEFKTPLGETTSTHLYTIDNTANINSPWIGIATVALLSVYGQVGLTVRSFDVFTQDVFNNIGEIPAGSQVMFKRIRPAGGSFSDVAVGDVTVLLASHPYEPADRSFDVYVDGAAGKDTGNAAFFVNDREIITDSKYVKSLFPPVQPV